MNTSTKRNEKEEILENLPPPEKTAELLAKANKVSSWMSELKQMRSTSQSRRNCRRL